MHACIAIAVENLLKHCAGTTGHLSCCMCREIFQQLNYCSKFINPMHDQSVQSLPISSLHAVMTPYMVLHEGLHQGLGSV